MKINTAPVGETPSRLIDAKLKELTDWRGPALARVRALIHQAVPDVVETWKWRGSGTASFARARATRAW
jgi:hypothetical protein